MNIVKTGTTYRLFDKSVEVGDRLEPRSYRVDFSMNSGFFLVEMPDPDLRDERVYGNHEQKVEKVFGAYAVDPRRNLGVILSGEKGIGKTLFAKMASARAIKEGLPVIYVNDFFQGLPDFFAKITQDCLVVFDEFDKNFCSNSTQAVDRTACQDSLLTMFDGIYGGHKLFVITCNSLDKLSDFYVNRPGRFRYHIRFDFPTQDEVIQYLKDKLGTKFVEKEAESVARFSSIVPLSYDCLAAIAAELALGQTFKDAMGMLNIIRIDDDKEYAVSLKFRVDGGEIESTTLEWDYPLDLFATEDDEKTSKFTVNPYLRGVTSDNYDRFFVGTVLVRRGNIRKFCKIDRVGRIHLPPTAFEFFRIPDNKITKSNGYPDWAANAIKAFEPVELELYKRYAGHADVTYRSVL